MKRFTSGLVTVLLASGTSVFGFASQAQAAIVQVSPADLGPRGPWFRLQDQPGNADRAHGVQEVSPFAAPDTFNGSLHLAVGPGEQSQAAHYFPPTPLDEIAASPLSYNTYVDSAHSSATGTGPNLQLPIYCLGEFTTLSFQPQLATDAQGNHGIVPDTWQHFASGPEGIWTSSRSIPGTPITAGGDYPLSTYVSTCTGANSRAVGVIANVGTLGDPNATLDTYVDNITAGGSTYDFAVDRRGTGTVELEHGESSRHERRVEGTVTFESPADGPHFRHVGTRITIADGRQGLDPAAVQLTADGVLVPLAQDARGELTGIVPGAHLTDLLPGQSVSTHIEITFMVPDRLERVGQVTVTAELLAQGFTPLQPTGVTGRDTIRP
ncbi:hypothetical protein ACIQOV_34695 [Kitasatospora sp. NPDC091257]|uniref:hypothetical protein n=1 Tax=unclassified Kitasatospora TaxID=2633591 RepID=UPI002F914098